jgi:hypothetical protein
MAADVYTGELRDGRTVDLYGWELDGDGPLEVTYVFEVTLPITQLTRRDFQTVNIDPSLLKHTMATELQTCAICLDEIAEDCGRLKCLHYFHTLCITRWAGRRSGTCPVCREKIRAADYQLKVNESGARPVEKKAKLTES